jgi:hypothetical protein
MAFYLHHGQQQMSANRWRQARYTWLIKRRFVERYPKLVAALPKRKLNELIDRALYQRGFDAFWRRDLLSAQKIFRMLLRTGVWAPRDLKYLLPSLLPSRAFQYLVTLADRDAGRVH